MSVIMYAVSTGDTRGTRVHVSRDIGGDSAREFDWSVRRVMIYLLTFEYECGMKNKPLRGVRGFSPPGEGVRKGFG
eukprot:1319650-Amorphochlora_amoeboformis.AAC.2